MNETNINLTPEVVAAVYELQQRNMASTAVEMLQTILVGVIRNEMGSNDERLRIADNILWMQDTFRDFILPEKGGAQ